MVGEKVRVGRIKERWRNRVGRIKPRDPPRKVGEESKIGSEGKAKNRD